MNPIIAPSTPTVPTAATQPTHTFDVVVAGAGPSGVTTAVLLSQAGLRVGVLEARGAEPVRPNIIQLREQSLRVLDEAGMKDGLRGAWPDAAQDPGHTHAIHRVEAAGRDRFAAAGVTALYDTPVQHVRSGADGVTISVKDAASGADQIVHAKYLINATGGRLGTDNRVEIEGATDPATGDLSRLQAADPDRFVLIPHPFNPGVPKGAHMREGTVPRPSGEAAPMKYNVMQNPRDGAMAVTRPPRWMRDTSDVDVIAAFSRAEVGTDTATGPAMTGDLGPTGTPILIAHRHDIARSARVGNVLSVGDAVSRVHPKTGWGTNQGIEDAKLAADAVVAAIQDPAQAEQVLDGYNQRVMQRHAEWLAHSIDYTTAGMQAAERKFPDAVSVIRQWAPDAGGDDEPSDDVLPTS